MSGAATENPSVTTLRARFGASVGRSAVLCGDTIVHVARDPAHQILAWLRDAPDERYDYLVDVTAVEYRDRERPLEVVYQLRSLARNAQLRVKIELPRKDDLEVDSVVDLWNGANWLEREVYDLFGVRFRGHPDLRRIMMPENYAEGHPLRKDFPLRGRFSRAEQTRRALSMDTEDFYSPQELVFMQPEDEVGELPGRGSPPGAGRTELEGGQA